MSTAFKQVADNATSTTTTNLTTIGVTSIAVAASDGSKFPTPGNGFVLTLWNGPTPGADPNMEKVAISGKLGDVLTSAPTAKAHTSPCNVGLLDGSGNIVDLQTAINSLETTLESASIVNSLTAPNNRFPLSNGSGGYDWVDYTGGGGGSGGTTPATFTALGTVRKREYNVREYGATGNGTTNDKTAIDAAVAACSAGGGGTVYFPPGVYGVGAGGLAVIPGGVWLVGSGYDSHSHAGAAENPPQMSVIKAIASMTTLIQLGSDATITDSGQAGACVADLVINGNSLANYVVRTAARRNMVMRCDIYKGLLATVKIDGQNSTVFHCAISGEGAGTPLSIDGYTDHKIWYCQVKQSATTSACIAVSASYVQIFGCHIWQGGNGISTAGNLIKVTSNSDVIISHNELDGTLSDQISIQGFNMTINNNRFFIPGGTVLPDNTISCIKLESGLVSNMTITGNEASSTTGGNRYKAFVTSAGGTKSRIVLVGNVVRYAIAVVNGFIPASSSSNVAYDGTNSVYTNNKGISTFSGDGSTVAFTIPHSLGIVPSSVTVTPGSSAAANQFYVTAGATNIIVTFTAAPAVGTNNVVLNWSAEI